MKYATMFAGCCTGLFWAASLPAYAAEDFEFFEKKVRPVLVEHCYSCHSAEAKKSRGGLMLDSKVALLKGGDSGPGLIAGKSKESLLLKLVRHEDPDRKMPPKGKLPAEVIADLEKWIADGAPDPRDGNPIKAARTIDLAKERQHWAYQPLVRAPLPTVKNSSWVKTPIDAFISAKLENQGLNPVPPAGKREWIRRATFAMLGLPPTPEDVEAFVKDTSANAYDTVIDRLLASPHYGERWGRHWLDVARYAEDQAHTFGVKPNTQAFRYRDWVIDALNRDVPFDQFVKLQVAADVMPMADEERIRNLPALGFFGLGAQYYKNTDAAKAAADELDDRVDTLCRGFLGLTVSCARCHDHMFDPIPQMDYYSLAGIFKNSPISDLPLGPKAEVARYQEGQTKLKKATQDAKELLEAERKALADSQASKTAEYAVAAWRFTAGKGQGMKADQFAQQNKLESETFGRWVKFLKNPPNAPVFLSCRQYFQQPKLDQENQVREFAETLQKEVLAAFKDAKKKMNRDFLAPFLADQGPFKLSDKEVQANLSTDKKAKLEGYQKDAERLKTEYPQTAPPMAHAVVEANNPANMKVMLRGNPAKLGDEAPRRFLKALAGEQPPTFSKGSGRLELADALASTANPLTYRVMVNRIWHHHFGRGLVSTTSNFGTLGERPSHPELLDYLAQRLIDLKGSLKGLHREILKSAVYQMSSAPDPNNLTKDADNRWLWRMPRSRLDIESWRDAMLAVSGTLDVKMGGPTYDLKDASIKRRTVYAKVSRHDLNSMLRLFDFPDANITAEKRTETTVPQQQLFVLNSPFVIDQAKAFAARVQKVSLDDEERIKTAFELAFARAATDQEITLAQAFLQGRDEGSQAIPLTRWERFAQVLLGSNEFLYVD